MPDNISKIAATLPAEFADQLKLYKAGKRVTFSNVKIPTGTPFQQKVWKALCTIPYGQTITYGELAKKVNSSPRAVGGAVGANPLPILIPCHRVMGAGGKMTGYSAVGGITTKQQLLKLEGALR